MRQSAKPQLQETRHPFGISAERQNPDPTPSPTSRLQQHPRASSPSLPPQQRTHKSRAARSLGPAERSCQALVSISYHGRKRGFNPVSRHPRPRRFRPLLRALMQLFLPARGVRGARQQLLSAALADRSGFRRRHRHTKRPAIHSPRSKQAWPPPRGEGGWMEPRAFPGKEGKTLMLDPHTQDCEDTKTSCRCRGGKDSFISSGKNHSSPKSGRGSPLLLGRSRGHLVSSGPRVRRESTGLGKHRGSSLEVQIPNAPPAGEAAADVAPME